MRLIICLFTAVLLASCSGKKTVAASDAPAVKNPPVTEAKTPVSSGLEEFLGRFESIATTHNKTAMLELMDMTYKTEQHDKALKGNTDQFLDAFFTNYQTNGAGLKTIKLGDIKEVKRIEIMPNDGNYTVVYHITGDGATIKCDWLVMTRKEAGKTVYGFYGPM